MWILNPHPPWAFIAWSLQYSLSFFLPKTLRIERFVKLGMRDIIYAIITQLQIFLQTCGSYPGLDTNLLAGACTASPVNVREKISTPLRAGWWAPGLPYFEEYIKKPTSLVRLPSSETPGPAAPNSYNHINNQTSNFCTTSLILLLTDEYLW